MKKEHKPGKHIGGLITEKGQNDQKRKEPLKSVINTIVGGFARGGTSYSFRKSHLHAIQSVNM